MLQGYDKDRMRSPFGRHAGAHSGNRPDFLAAQVVRALIERSELSVERIEAHAKDAPTTGRC